MSETAPQKRISTLAMVSILVNVLLIGLIGGRMIGQAGQNRDVAAVGATAETRVAQRILENVPRRDRVELRRLFVQTLRENRNVILERNLARRAFANALVAEPYDDASVRAAMADLREADLVLQTAMQDALATSFQRLTPEQREALARSIESGAPIGNGPPPSGPRPGDGGRPLQDRFQAPRPD